MKNKYRTVAALAVALLAVASVSAQQNPGFDGRPIDLTAITSQSPLVRMSQTQNVPANGKIQVTCHASYAPGETTLPELVQYFAVFSAVQPDEKGATSLALVAYVKVEPGNTYEFSPTVPTKVVIMGATKPFLNRPLDNDRLPQPPPLAPPAPAPKLEPKKAPKAPSSGARPPSQVT